MVKEILMSVSGTTKIRYRVQLRFRRTQHERDIKLMESIRNIKAGMNKGRDFTLNN